MKLKDIKESKEALTYLFMKDIPGKYLRLILEFQESIEKELQFFNTANNKLIKKYGEKQKNNNYLVTPKMDGWDNYIKEYNDLLNTEIKIKKIDLNFIYELDSFKSSYVIGLKKFAKE